MERLWNHRGNNEICREKVVEKTWEEMSGRFIFTSKEQAMERFSVEVTDID